MILLDRPLVMGVLNLTPDSFSDGGEYSDPSEALERATRMLAEGADLVDVGGESTRPGAQPVEAEEEWRRIGPVASELGRRGIRFSVDTRRAAVAARALDAGAAVVNDVTAFGEGSEMARQVAMFGAGAVLMHMRGTPETMQSDVGYDDLLGEIGASLSAAADLAQRHGVGPDQIVLDPGIGFGKSAAGNLEVLNRLDCLTGLGYPILVGPSRKAFLGSLLGTGVYDRLEGTVAACVLARDRGACIFRVHDVLAVRRALDVTNAILRQEVPSS
ncbi:MAG: dihydropteroate synthase [Gemmatimonadota bacterium]